ncbi:hypothetical protein [Haloarchaeobius sp. TZWSO28]|uniref:hypothetical protein n=1 Tax=Haloarchaeobius sp. TZWSO28 TaxID=3446119 RepID=UPI003EB6E06E
MLVVFPRRSLGQVGPLVSRWTGVDWRVWGVALVAFLVFVRVTKLLGAPAVFEGTSATGRPLFFPTGYGIGTILVLLGGYLAIQALGHARRYRELTACPIHTDQTTETTGCVSVGGTLAPDDVQETPVSGADSVWYAYEVWEQATGGPFSGAWFPVDRGESGIRCRVEAPGARDYVLDLASVSFLPSMSQVELGEAERTVAPDEPVPAELGRTETVGHADGGTDTGRRPRRYREWFLSPGTSVVASGDPQAASSPGTVVLGGEGRPVRLGIGSTYDSLCTSIRRRAVFGGASGLVFLFVGLALVGLFL